MGNANGRQCRRAHKRNETKDQMCAENTETQLPTEELKDGEKAERQDKPNRGQKRGYRDIIPLSDYIRSVYKRVRGSEESEEKKITDLPFVLETLMVDYLPISEAEELAANKIKAGIESLRLLRIECTADEVPDCETLLADLTLDVKGTDAPRCWHWCQHNAFVEFKELMREFPSASMNVSYDFDLDAPDSLRGISIIEYRWNFIKSPNIQIVYKYGDVPKIVKELTDAKQTWFVADNPDKPYGEIILTPEAYQLWFNSLRFAQSISVFNYNTDENLLDFSLPLLRIFPLLGKLHGQSHLPTT